MFNYYRFGKKTSNKMIADLQGQLLVCLVGVITKGSRQI